MASFSIGKELLQIQPFSIVSMLGFGIDPFLLEQIISHLKSE